MDGPKANLHVGARWRKVSYQGNGVGVRQGRRVERGRALKEGSLCWESKPSLEAPAPHCLDSERTSTFLWEAVDRCVLRILLFVTCIPESKVLLMEYERLPLQEAE